MLDKEKCVFVCVLAQVVGCHSVCAFVDASFRSHKLVQSFIDVFIDEQSAGEAPSISSSVMRWTALETPILVAHKH